MNFKYSFVRIWGIRHTLVANRGSFDDEGVALTKLWLYHGEQYGGANDGPTKEFQPDDGWWPMALCPYKFILMDDYEHFKFVNRRGSLAALLLRREE